MATVYRNLQEQVYENAKDIEELQVNKVNPDEVVSIVSPIINRELTEKKNLFNSSSEICVRSGRDKPNEETNGGNILFSTYNSFNDDKVDKLRKLVYMGEFFKYILGNDENDENNVYRFKFPLKSGTLALVEDIPVNTGYIKAHTIENDADKNYTTTINLGSGNSGSTLSLTAPGDNGIATLELANEYNQGSTSIKFTADKLVFGNTEITEAQLQQLLQLIQNQ